MGERTSIWMPLDVPAVLEKNYPQLIHTEEKSLHRSNPTEVNQLYEVGNLYDWRTNNYAMHLKLLRGNSTKVPELYLIHGEPSTQIYGRAVKVSEHHKDIVRLEAVLEYGGIYLDLDAMVVKPLDPLLNYEVVMGYEHENGLCNGAIIAVAWADFLKIRHLEYKSFQDKQWAEHSVHLPAVLARKHKNLIHTEERSFYRPNWEDNDLRQLYEVGQIYDLKTNNYVVHLWIRKHGIEHNSEDIQTWNTTVGHISDIFIVVN
ncbi:uncharacterized protein LOC121381677 [Gigantopelta aegis]|uniref:uncharacterized protein LOC121381677 n=1 Tax=Gigantopelta aegis TaxID=1735272 RepID=UPI001B88E58A|nr:uncharacterized protein LOC121381677 [Gigantopelta aegis]